MHRYNVHSYPDLNPTKITSPTCEDLGIPTEAEDIAYSFCRRGLMVNPSLHIDGIRFDPVKGNPFSPMCLIPVPSQITLDSGLEPSFIRKRNERERERVRCVNDGYERLKEHLPIENKDRRISKVETLRAAIQYIKHLQSLLDEADEEEEEEGEEEEEETETSLKRKSSDSETNVKSVTKRMKRERQN